MAFKLPNSGAIESQRERLMRQAKALKKPSSFKAVLESGGAGSARKKHLSKLVREIATKRKASKLRHKARKVLSKVLFKR